MNDHHLSTALAAAQAGDSAGFTELWRTLQPQVLRYLRVVASGAAEDVASETWLQVARDLRGFRGDATEFRVWLFRIARHRGIDEVRRSQRRREDTVDDVHDSESDGGRDAAHETFEVLDTDWALRVIASLPRQQAEAVMLRVVAGLDVAQTAQVLGKRPGAVRVAAMRGLRQLADHAEVQARQADRDQAQRSAPVNTGRLRQKAV